MKKGGLINSMLTESEEGDQLSSETEWVTYWEKFLTKLAALQKKTVHDIRHIYKVYF